MKDQDQEAVINRLLTEVRQKNVLLDSVRLEINRANMDYEKLSMVGAVKNLRLRLKEVEAENRKLKKENDRLIHGK